MKAIHVAVLVGVVALLALPGCGPGVDNATPGAAAKSLVKAMIAGDSKAIDALTKSEPPGSPTNFLLQTASESKMVGSDISDYEIIDKGDLAFVVRNKRVGEELFEVRFMFADGKYFFLELPPFAKHSDAIRGTFNEAFARLKKGPNEEVRRDAAAVIVGLGPEAVMRALAATTEASSDQSPLALCKPVNQAFAAVGEPAVAAMIRAIASDQLPVRVAAADVLREMGPRAAKAVPALATIVGDRNRWVRSFACNALGNVGPAAAPAVDALLAVVQHEDPYTRRHAVMALGQIGPAAVKAVPALKERANDTAEKDDVREAAGKALAKIIKP